VQGYSMPGPTASLCLIIALTGQPMRQAEAAGDFARALTYFIAISDSIEIPDGGVGDDSGVATLKTRTCHAAALAWSPACNPWAGVDDLRSFTFGFSAFDPDTGRSQRPKEPILWFPPGTRQRHAWLQVFLI